LAEIDSLSREARLRALVDGMLAGNIFDWGSSACVELYQNGSILDIYRQARAKLARPFLVDDFEAFAERALENAPDGSALSYRRVLLFCDNSGADAILGVLPMAREVVRGGGEAVLVANSLPALNDVTAGELVHILAAAAELCPILASASVRGGVFEGEIDADDRGGVLRVVASGHGGPCLDLRRVTTALADAAQGADLIVLVGMGRALHTNLLATFTCDSLKLAMVKNQRLASTLFAGKLYDCCCCFQKAGEIPGLPGPIGECCK
jgi:type II pantothenate kinase